MQTTVREGGKEKKKKEKAETFPLPKIRDRMNIAAQPRDTDLYKGWLIPLLYYF